MSKASEWAARRREAQTVLLEKGHRFTDTGQRDLFYLVDDDGDLALMRGDQRQFYLSPQQALDLARWILDTFGDAP